MFINFQQNRGNKSVITVHTNVFAQKNRKLHKFATTNGIFFKSTFQECIIIKRTCISIFSKICLVDQSKLCTQIYLQKFANSINLQLAMSFKKSRLSDMHYPLTDIQADFRINRPVRQRITAKKKISTDDRRTDVAHDNNR